MSINHIINIVILVVYSTLFWYILFIRDGSQKPKIDGIEPCYFKDIPNGATNVRGIGGDWFTFVFENKKFLIYKQE